MAELVSLLSTSYIIASNIAQFPFRQHSYPLTHLPFSDQTDLTYALRRFSNRRPAAFLAGVFLDIRAMRKMEEEVLSPYSSDETVMAFKSSHLDAVGGTQLTSAILAQLSMTTLQLDGLSDMHWSASGFMLSGILFGIVAVILSTMQQQVFGMLNDPPRVKLWLSSGYYEGDEKGRRHSPVDIGTNTASGGGRSSTTATKKQLKASVASLQIMRIPNTFLSFSAFAFLVSIGLFLGFSARQDLDRTPGRDNNQAVLILWLVTAFVAVSESAGCGIWKIWEDRRLERTSDAARGMGNGLVDDEEIAGGQAERVDDDERTALLTRSGDGSYSSDHRKMIDDGNRMGTLAKALEESAQAHAKCAEADREVARLMMQGT